MPRSRNALIVGGGIGGLAAGVALLRAGWSVQVLERTPIPRELGFGLLMASNAIAALRELGVAEQVVRQGVTPDTVEFRRTDGRRLRRLSGRSEDWPPGLLPVVIMRPVLHTALLDALPRDAVHIDCGVVRIDTDQHTARAHLADGRVVSGDVLIGADGIGSVVRAHVHPGEPPPQPSGYFALRGASAALHRLGDLGGIALYGPGVEAAAVRASATHIYWFISLLAADLRGGEFDPAAVLQRQAAGFDPQFRAIADATPTLSLRLDELLVRDPLPSWGRGRVTLLGDAAHPMLPHTGQGAAQALEDACALGRALASRGDVVEALRRYEAVRLRRTSRVVRSGPRIARITTTRNPIVSAVRNGAVRLLPAPAIVKALASVRWNPKRDLG